MELLIDLTGGGDGYYWNLQNFDTVVVAGDNNVDCDIRAQALNADYSHVVVLQPLIRLVSNHPFLLRSALALA